MGSPEQDHTPEKSCSRPITIPGELLPVSLHQAIFRGQEPDPEALARLQEELRRAEEITIMPPEFWTNVIGNYA